jgi:hypothetical protein
MRVLLEEKKNRQIPRERAACRCNSGLKVIEVLDVSSPKQVNQKLAEKSEGVLLAENLPALSL